MNQTQETNDRIPMDLTMAIRLLNDDIRTTIASVVWMAPGVANGRSESPSGLTHQWIMIGCSSEGGPVGA